MITPDHYSEYINKIHKIYNGRQIRKKKNPYIFVDESGPSQNQAEAEAEAQPGSCTFPATASCMRWSMRVCNFQQHLNWTQQERNGKHNEQIQNVDINPPPESLHPHSPDRCSSSSSHHFLLHSSARPLSLTSFPHFAAPLLHILLARPRLRLPPLRQDLRLRRKWDRRLETLDVRTGRQSLPWRFLSQRSMGYSGQDT